MYYGVQTWTNSGWMTDHQTAGGPTDGMEGRGVTVSDSCGSVATVAIGCC